MILRPGVLSGTMKSKYAGLGAYPVINDSCCQRNDPRCQDDTKLSNEKKGKLVALRNQLESINWETMSMSTERAGKKAMEALVKVENKITEGVKALKQGGSCFWASARDSGTWHGKYLPRGTPALFTEIDDAVKLGKVAMVKGNSEKAEQEAAAADAEAAAAQGGGMPSSGGPGPSAAGPGQSDEWYPAPQPSKGPLIIGALVILLGGVGLILFLRR